MTVRTVCVVGAGNMGAGIAQTSAQAGFETRLVDQDPAIAERGRARIAEGLAGLVAKGKMAAEERNAILARLVVAPDIRRAAEGADLAIEAVFESYDAKRPVFAALDAAAPAHAILATNTSSLAVTRLGDETGRADRVGGLHFFFPAMINRLVEVVKGERTSDATFAALMAVARRMGKVPIQTLDRPGFCVNRFFVPILNESCRLLEEGHGDIPAIEAAANRVFGTTMGPFELMNVTGVPISLHAQRTLHAELGPFYAPSRLLVSQVEGQKGPWDLKVAPREIDAETREYIEERLLAVAVGISARLVEEGVASAEDTEKGATVGLRWSRGPFTLANERGTHKALSAVSALFMRHGDHFPVAESLRALGAEDRPYRLRTVSFHAEGGVGVVVIERPAQLNALNGKVLEDLDAALDRLAGEDRVRAAVLTGEGKAFVAGADLKELGKGDPEAARRFTLAGQRVLRRIELSPKPIVAAVNGFALGGGMELALACDIIVASERAELGLPEVGLGIIPGFGGTQRLARRVGAARALSLILTTRRLSGKEAGLLGVVDEVAAEGETLARAVAIAESVARQAPLAVAWAKRAVREGLDLPLAEGLELEAELAIATFGTADQKEGFAAFLGRRPPVFHGR